MNQIDRMLIEHECQKLIIQYAMFNDMGEWDRLAETFTNDGSYIRPSAPDEAIVGRANIREAYKSRPPKFTQHIISNIVVTVEGATVATAISSIELYAGVEEAGDPIASHAPGGPLIGQFFDRLQLEDGKWLFSNRRGIITIK